MLLSRSRRMQHGRRFARSYRESVQQLADTWRAILTDRGSGEVQDLPGMAIRWADSKFPFWNCITFTDPGCDERLLEDRLAAAAAYMRQKDQPGLIWLFEDLLSPAARASLPGAIERTGLALSFPGFGMTGDFPTLTEPRHPELQFMRVTTEEQLQAYADLNSQAYGMPLEAGRDGLAGSRLWKSGMYSYLGVTKGAPVSAAAGRWRPMASACSSPWSRPPRRRSARAMGKPRSARRSSKGSRRPGRPVAFFMPRWRARPLRTPRLPQGGLDRVLRLAGVSASVSLCSAGRR